MTDDRDASAAADEEFDDRQLCPDGACTGLLGADGRCKVCGRSADGEMAQAPGASAATRPAPSDGAAEVAPGAADDGDRDGDGEDDRRLCPDGSCVGLIGTDGRCKVCGRAETDSGP